MNKKDWHEEIAIGIGPIICVVVLCSFYYLGWISEPIKVVSRYMFFGSFGYTWTLLGHCCYVNLYVPTRGHSIKNSIFYTLVYGGYFFWFYVLNKKTD